MRSFNRWPTVIMDPLIIEQPPRDIIPGNSTPPQRVNSTASDTLRARSKTRSPCTRPPALTVAA